MARDGVVKDVFALALHNKGVDRAMFNIVRLAVPASMVAVGAKDWVNGINTELIYPKNPGRTFFSPKKIKETEAEAQEKGRKK